MSAEREDEVVEIPDEWHAIAEDAATGIAHPEFGGRKEKILQAMREATIGQSATIAALKAKCAERERGHADAIEQWKAAEAKCVELTMALKAVFALIENGWLVRNTADDAKGGFGMPQFKSVQRLAKAAAALPQPSDTQREDNK